MIAALAELTGTFSLALAALAGPAPFTVFAVGLVLRVFVYISGGALNPAVAIAMGLGLSPAVWATALSGVVFAWLFVLLKKGVPPKVD